MTDANVGQLRAGRRRIRSRGASGLARDARLRLRRFRRASTLAVASAGLLLLVASAPSATDAQDPETVETDSRGAQVGGPTLDSLDAGAAVEEATGTLRELGGTAYRLLPKLGIAVGVLVLAGLLAWTTKAVLRGVLGSWERANALSALASMAIWLIALGAALSVIAGDARALVGSVGLFGLALSWALQAPIESFTGWLLNSFRGYYRIGDRIEVGDVFGDVARIDFLTTTVWEAGGPGKPVQAAQPTGALVTVPNSELLRAKVVNYTRDFPYVWDEVTVAVANESDLSYVIGVFRGVAEGLLTEEMATPAALYRQLLDRARLDYEIASEPQVYVSGTDSFTNVTVRYLVPARARRAWATRLLLALSEETARPTHEGKTLPGYPRTHIDLATREPEAKRAPPG